MDKDFRYREKWVHDLPVGKHFVRLWDEDGAVNGKSIRLAFQPLLSTGFVWPYVALMPDYHPGEGSMIGSVIPTRDVLLPSVIGGDLGCGMTAVRLPLQAELLKIHLPQIERSLREHIPVGTAHNAIVTQRVRDNPIWDRIPQALILANRMLRKLQRQFASMGGGNHFLELQQDREGGAWIMLHSGSRYLGIALRDYYVAQGRMLTETDLRLFLKVPFIKTGSALAENYLADLQYVLDFARESRKEMMLRALDTIASVAPGILDPSPSFLISSAYDVVHNYISLEEHFGEKLYLHRKGAIHLSKGSVGLIPGSMGTLSYVVEGRGNVFGFDSCSHGAGRSMSRSEAFHSISDKDFQDSMSGVVFQFDSRIKDEAPAAYKDIRHVMRSQKDLVKVVHELHPILSIKGH